MPGARFYFDWSNYRTMLRLLRRDPPASKRWRRYFGFLVGVPTIAAIHAVCFALDPILFRSLRDTQVIAPTFCIGHARSGTTYLHRLMAADPQFSYALMYELFFPSLLEKRLLRLLFGVDAAVFGKRLRHRLDAIEERRFAPTDDMHKTGFFVPEEDDAFLTWSLCSGFWILMFPFMGELDFYYVDQWPERKRRRAMNFYKQCVRRQIAANGGGTHLSKNPTFCGRVDALIETFPVSTPEKSTPGWQPCSINTIGTPKEKARMSTEPSQAALHAAWTDMIDALNRARDAVDSAELHAPPVTAQGLVDGYRYLLGFVFSGIERAFSEDPDYPYFRRAIQPLDKANIDNADALYLSASIDGAKPYRVRGRLADGAKAPQYIIFEAHSVYAGDTGSLAELGPGGRVVTGLLDTADLAVDGDGRFEIMLAPQRPAEYEGNFVATATADGTKTACFLIARMLFHDWEHEVSPDLHIVQIGNEGAHPRPIDPAAAAQNIRRVGMIVENQMRFWNEFYDVVLEAHGDKNGDGFTLMPRNDLNQPALANLAMGGGQSTNVYSGGVYDLQADEALLIDVIVPVEPAYMGFHLSNLWGESLDYANHTCSLNGFQSEPDPDGTIRYVVAETDPGVPNWLDTVGHRGGFLTLRWTYSTPPPELPKATVTKVPLASVGRHLPASTRTVSPEERREQIRVRQEHVQRRYRQY